jgi:hypothetical protein
MTKSYCPNEMKFFYKAIIFKSCFISMTQKLKVYIDNHRKHRNSFSSSYTKFNLTIDLKLKIKFDKTIKKLL